MLNLDRTKLRSICKGVVDKARKCLFAALSIVRPVRNKENMFEEGLHLILADHLIEVDRICMRP